MSELIQGADKLICLSPIPKVFLSVICTTEVWEKKQRESEKWVWKAPAGNREKSQGTQYSEAGSLLADRQRVLVTGTSLPSCSSNRPSAPCLSWEAPGLPKDSLSHCPAPAAPHRGQGQRGHLQFAERWQQEMCQSLRLTPSLGGR